MSQEETLQYLAEAKTSYQLVFNPNQPADAFVLRDIARFCRANETCLVKDKDGKIDTEKTLVLLGRNEVWQRLQEWLGLNPEQLLSLKTGNPLTRRTE